MIKRAAALAALSLWFWSCYTSPVTGEENKMIIDVLKTALVGGSGDFVAALAPPNEVSLNPIATRLDISNANGDMWFESGDNIRLFKAEISMPYDFGQGQGFNQGSRITIVWRNNAGAITVIPELGTTGTIAFPTWCNGVEFPDGIFIETPKVGPPFVRYQLAMTFVEMKASMVNLPASLVGVTVSPRWYFTIQHSRAMQAVP